LLSAQGLIDHCTASGSNDTGIYVGQSHDVVIRNSVAHDNVNGFEIENSSNVRAVRNNAFDNTVGILVDLLPSAVVAVPGYTPVESSTGNRIAFNRVFANNRPNSASPGDLAAVEPGGSGIVVVGGNHTTVQLNDVFANAFGGIVLLSGTDLIQLAPGTPGYPKGVDSNPNNTLIQKNTLDLNGFTPPTAGFPLPSDLIWTGGGSNNHWRANHYTSSFPKQLP
jgi:parallel beta-helix repeat protein